MLNKLLAHFFRLLFRIPFFKKRFYPLYIRLFRPYRLFDAVQTKVNIRGVQFTLHLDDWIQQSLFFTEEYEAAELMLMEHLLKDKSCFIDVGANIGLYTLLASRAMPPESKIIAFEPFLKNYNAFRTNILQNGIENIQAERIAVSDRNGEIELFYDESKKNRGMVSAISGNETAGVERVQAVTLDSFLEEQNMDRIDFVKIDVEGYEFAVLSGMQNTLKRYHPTILIEIFDPELNPHYDAIHDLLNQAGYEKHFITDSGTLSDVVANPLRKNYLFRTKD